MVKIAIHLILQLIQFSNWIIIFAYMFKKLGNIAFTTFKYSSYVLGTTLTLSSCYLYYINTHIGGIYLNKKESTEYYQQTFKMTEFEATNMFYWVYYDIALRRLLTFWSYNTYCSKLNKKVVEPSLNYYQKASIFAKIDAVKTKKEKAELIKEMKKIREVSFESKSLMDWILKEVRKQQKLMDSYKILGLSDVQKEKIDKIVKFYCDNASEFKDPQVDSYIKQLPRLEQIFPGDYIHKIIFI